MIGSHDSYSYQKAKNWFVNLVSKLWKCQDKTIEEQYELGVRFFDVRVVRDNNIWRTAHGLAKFDTTFSNLKEICKYFSPSYLRIWMEDGSDEDWEIFRKEALECYTLYPNFLQAYRKNHYELFSRLPYVKYYTCEMEKFSNIISSFIKNPIKTWAKKHNPKLTKEMIEDLKTIYFMDYAV